MAIHAYVRASTNKQVLSAEVQQDQIRRYCGLNGLLPELPSRVGPPVRAEPFWYVDAATSGKTLLRDREAGGVLSRALSPGDHVVVAKLDRAFRRLGDCVTMMEDFRRRDIRLHVCNLLGGAIDLSSPIGQFLMHILAAFAELERAFIAERTSEALQQRKRRGLAATGAVRMGFRHEYRTRTEGGRAVRERVEVPDDYERRIMKMVLHWRQEDPSRPYDWIRQQLNYTLKLPNKQGREWTDRAVRRACKAEAILQLRETLARDGRCERPSR